MQDVKQRIGERIRVARDALGLTQVQMAERMGVDRLTVLRIEKGSRDLKTLELHAIAQILGVTINSLVEEEEVKERWEVAFRTSGVSDEDREVIAWARKVFLNYRAMQDRATNLGIR